MELLDLKVSGFTEWCATQKNFPFPFSNTTTKTLPSKLLSQGSNEQNKLSTNSKKTSFLGNWIKISISVVNFSTESAAKPTI